MVLLSLSLLFIATISLAAPSDSHSTLAGRAPCKQNFKTTAKETCYTLDEKYKLVSGSVYKHNTFLNCANVWGGTDICVPNGPYLADVCKSTYRSKKGDSCASLDLKFDLADGAIKGVNAYLDCKAGIWENSPICIPHGPRRTSPPTTPNPYCRETYRSVAGDTCQSIEDKFTLATGAVNAFNDFVTCDNIWKDTPVCIPHGLKKTDCRLVYVSVKNDKCASLESVYNLPAGALKTANGFLDCTNIWEDEFDWYSTVPGTTCAAFEEERDIFPGAIKAHTPGIDCDNVAVNTVYCSPRGPKMADVCASVHVVMADETCGSVATSSGRTPEAIAAANPLQPCESGPAYLPYFTRVCIPEPPSAPSCMGTAVTVVGVQTCAAIESVNGWFPFTIAKIYPSLSCDAVPENTKLCIPKGTPKMDDVCKQMYRATLQYAATCTEIWAVFGLPSVPYLQALNPFLPCHDSAIRVPAGTVICWASD